METAIVTEYDLPGFRFHPTEQELVGFYLKNITQGKRMNLDVIRSLDLYRYDPWELPRLSVGEQRELFFFVPREKNGSGRTNRIAVSGYWKATGSDRPILDGRLGCIGIRKTLVFYEGRAPRGRKTDWIMNEYRLPDHRKPKVEAVVCRVYRKANPLKQLENQPSVDDDLRCSNKLHETRYFSPAEASRSPLEDGCIGRTGVSLLTAENTSNICGEFIEPAVKDEKCEGFLACRNHSRLGFVDLLDSSSDRSCLDPPLATPLMDGESDTGNQFLVAPRSSMDCFCDEAALYSHLGLEGKHPAGDLWDTPNAFASSAFEDSFFDQQEYLWGDIPNSELITGNM